MPAGIQLAEFHFSDMPRHARHVGKFGLELLD